AAGLADLVFVGNASDRNALRRAGLENPPSRASACTGEQAGANRPRPTDGPALLAAVENGFSRTFGESGPAVGGTPGGVVFRPGSTRCLFRYFLLLGSWSWSPWPLVRMGSRSTCVRSEGSFRAPTAAS